MTLAILTIVASRATAQVQLPDVNIADGITIAADSGNRFQQGSYEVLILHGSCYINQGLVYARSQDAVLWVERTGTADKPQFKVIAYLEGDATIDYQQSAGSATGDKMQARLADKTWFGRFTSNLPLTIRIDKVSGEPAVKPAIFQRGMKARDPNSPDAPGGLPAGVTWANGGSSAGKVLPAGGWLVRRLSAGVR